jgi:predicted permease
MNIIFIITNLILPIFLQIAAGYAIQKKFDIDISTLSKIQFYIFIPALSFTKIYDTKIQANTLFNIIMASIFIFLILYLISYIMAKVLKYPKTLSSAFVNSVVFYNSGNYCLPLMQLLYNNPFAMSVQIIVMMVQNVATNTFGIFNSNAGSKGIKQAIIDTFKVPIIYSIIAAVLIRILNIGVWKPVWNALDSLGYGLVPLALVTLGAQLANTKISFKTPEVYVSNFIRLIISPFIAYLLVMAIGVTGIAGQVIIISAAAPTAVNTVLLAIEYNNEPDFSSRAVLMSTLFSAFTVALTIYLSIKFVV